MPRPRGKFQEGVDSAEVTPEQEALLGKKVAEAEEELSATRVNFRWGKEQLDLIKKVADMIGVPYQTYLKMAIMKQAQADLRELQAAYRAMPAPAPVPQAAMPMPPTGSLKDK